MIFIPRETDSAHSITLDEFNDRVERLGPIATLEDYTQVVPHLRALANNRTLLVDFYNREFDDIEAFKQKQNLTVQTLMLSRLKNCDVRMVFWPAVKAAPTRTDLDAFSYEAAHSHNFHFITIGYWGPGYATKLYRLGRPVDSGVVGEQVELEYTGEHVLGVGDVMVYEQDVDIHTQSPPSELSISLNVIPKQGFFEHQYLFDLEKRSIAAVIEESSQLKYLEALAGELGTSTALEAFNELRAASFAQFTAQRAS